MSFKDDNSFLEPSRLVFMARRAPASVVASADDEEDELLEQQSVAQMREQERELERRRLRESQIARADVGEDTRQIMRECLASDSTERQALLDRFLNGEIENERRFIEEFRGIERDESLWRNIFDIQRTIRKKIQDVQWKLESYAELMPQQKANFENLLKRMSAVNKQDAAVDRGLTRLLHGLVFPARGDGVLKKEEAQKLYMLDPLQSGFERVLSEYQSRIAESREGRAAFKTLLALKKEEAKMESDFSRLTNDVDKIIQKNLSKARLFAEREVLIKNASRAVGIRLKEGTEIEYNELDDIVITGRKRSAKITKIEFDTVTIYDEKGSPISKMNGIPRITLDGNDEMTLGRFKKWADAHDAVEKVSNTDEVEEALGFKTYGIKLHKGMDIAYPRHHRDKQTGELLTTMTYVQVADVRDSQIFFNAPVPFAPGFPRFDDTEMRDSLTFGEFIKWWLRYEAEKSVSLHELRDLLYKYNEHENKTFGWAYDENPPIVLENPGEKLRYPDESGSKFLVTGISPDGITLDNGKTYAPPEFFHWVKNNHVQKEPPVEKEPEEKAKEKVREAEIQQDIQKEELEKEHGAHAGLQKYVDVAKGIEQREAGTLVDKIAEMWWTTQFLSLADLWNMIIEIKEFVKRKHERRSKGRYGEVGGRLPWVIGTEFERVKQAAENEEVNKYKEAMEQWSIEQVKRTLYDTTSKDEAKACIMTLVHHGEMRWDDHHLWRTLNRLTSRYTLQGTTLHIPDPGLIPPGMSGEDMVEPAVDALWGAGTGTNWFQENINKYNSNKNNFEYKFKNLEADPKGTGGPEGECSRLLRMWRNGQYVNPQDYEEMIDGAIKYGKMGAEAKMFFIIAGCAARQGDRPDGETLLSLDRPGELDSKYLNQFPLLDFFTQETVWDPTIWDSEKQQFGKRRKFQLKDYEKWVDEYFPDDFEQCKVGAQFSRFLWEVMMMGEMVRTRISKGIRNAENMDHDDAHLFIPPTTPTEVDGLTTGPTGQKKYFTNSGYANAYPGFSHYIISLSYALEEAKDEDAKKLKKEALRDAINAFVRYDAILDNRFLKKDGDHRARLDDRHWNRHCVVDPTVDLKVHRDQMRELILSIGDAYGQDWRTWIYGPKTGSYFDAKEKAKQDEYEKKLDSLKEIIPKLFAQDGGQKALEVIARARNKGLKEDQSKEVSALRGMINSRRPDYEALVKLKHQAAERRTHRAAAGHGH